MYKERLFPIYDCFYFTSVSIGVKTHVFFPQPLSSFLHKFLSKLYHRMRKINIKIRILVFHILFYQKYRRNFENVRLRRLKTFMPYFVFMRDTVFSPYNAFTDAQTFFYFVKKWLIMEQLKFRPIGILAIQPERPTGTCACADACLNRIQPHTDVFLLMIIGQA